jgi:hypothetical protein
LTRASHPIIYNNKCDGPVEKIRTNKDIKRLYLGAYIPSLSRWQRLEMGGHKYIVLSVLQTMQGREGDINVNVQARRCRKRLVVQVGVGLLIRLSEGKSMYEKIMSYECCS